MDITIDESRSVPVYRQIINQVVHYVLDESLLANNSLPTIRQLSVDLDVTNATVAKAYQILESSKIIATAGRRGTFIHENAKENAQWFVQSEVRNQFRDFLNEQLRFGISFSELNQQIQKELSLFEVRKK